METKLLKILLPAFIAGSMWSCQPAPEPAPKPVAEETVVVEEVAVNRQFDNVKDLVAFTKEEITQISPEELKLMMDENQEFYLIDVRTAKEHEAGYVPNATSLSRGLLEFKIGSESWWENNPAGMPSKDAVIVIYCKTGGRGSLATKSLQDLKYTNVLNLDGGYNAWAEKYPELITKP